MMYTTRQGKSMTTWVYLQLLLCILHQLACVTASGAECLSCKRQHHQDDGGRPASTGPLPGIYRRTLPDSFVPFNSPEGKRIFQEALAQGHMECYFRLAAQFLTQDEPTYCGVSTLVMVLNTLEVDPGRLWKGIWRWYDEDKMDCCKPVEVLRETGVNLDQFACLASCNALDVSVTRPEQSSLEDFRNTVKRLTKQEHEIMVTSYSRGVMGQTGDGHFSPIGGYHPGLDLVLVMDIARYKYPPHWASLSLLWDAMKGVDTDTGLSRGLITLKKSAPLRNVTSEYRCNRWCCATPQTCGV